MAYTRNIDVRGTETVDGNEVVITFNYSPGVAPERVNFNINLSEGLTIYGSCTKTDIEYYNVNGGIVTDEFMILIKEKCITAITNYETI